MVRVVTARSGFAGDGLVAEIASVKTSLEALPVELVGSRRYFYVSLRPQRTGATAALRTLLDSVDLAVAGSRRVAAASNVALVLAGDTTALGRLGDIAASDGLPTHTTDALAEITAVGMFAAEDVLRVPAGGVTASGEVWDSVLHPYGSGPQGTVPADDATFDKWCGWVASLGGSVVTEYRRPTGGLTWCPVRLVAGTEPDAARFNPLRSLRPVAKVGLRNASTVARHT